MSTESCLSLKTISSLFQFAGDLTLSLSLLFMQDTSPLGQVSKQGAILVGKYSKCNHERQLFTLRIELRLRSQKGKVQG